MEFRIYQGRDIIVYRNEKIYLTAKPTNRWGFARKFYLDGKLIMESVLVSLAINLWIKIRYQALPTPITTIRKKGLFNWILSYGGHELYIQNKTLIKVFSNLYLDKVLIGKIMSSRSYENGYKEFIASTETNNEEINLYLLLLFLVQLPPVG